MSELCTQAYPVLDAELARLSPYLRAHLNVHGQYVFSLPISADGVDPCATRTPRRSRSSRY